MIELLASSIAERLTSDDDPDLWTAATNTILADAVCLGREGRESVYSQIGCCRHWIRPHQAPFGYDKTTTGFSFSAKPELEWSVCFKWTGAAWELGRTGGHCLLLRIAIPARTAKHLQAAVHTVWIPRSPSSKDKLVQVYRFRKNESLWQLSATHFLGREGD